MSATAWILSFGGNRHAAIGERELVHVLADEPPLFTIPMAPAHCARAFVWQERVLPLMDVPARLADSCCESKHVAVVRWRDEVTGTVEHGGVVLATPPRRVSVDDDQQCAESDARWAECSQCCFEHAELGAVSIISLSKVFNC